MDFTKVPGLDVLTSLKLVNSWWLPNFFLLAESLFLDWS